MQKLAEISIRRPVFASMLILALCVIGAASYFRLGVDRFPSVDLPTVTIRTQLPGATAEEVETEISKRIEEAVNTIEGINELRSISGPGSSVVIVTFNLSRDIDAAAQDVRDRVAAVLRSLPDDATPPLIAKSDNDSQPVLTVALSGDRALRELTELAGKVVKVRLERSAGVGEVRIVGGLGRAMNIWIEADRLEAYRLPVTVVREAIIRQNADTVGGNVTHGTHEETLRTVGRLADAKAFNDLVVTTIDGAPVRIRDIGWAEDGTKEQRSTARLNGEPTVILEVRRQSGANTVAVIEGVRKSLAAAEGELPAGLGLTVIQDQSRYIYAALHEINTHLILGSILACLVVFAFMRNWRSTVIAAVAIPASVVSTFGMMWALDFTLNSVTMLALVLMVGVVIDDAIVVLENIFRFVEEKGMRPFEAARAATADIGLAVMATTLSLVVIFIPVSFMSSISGRFLYQFGITAAVAVMVSLLVSFTLTPMMSARMLRTGGADSRSGEGAPRSRTGFYRKIDAGYVWLLAFAIRHRLLVASLSLAVILSTVPLYKLLRQDYLPGNVDEGEFNVQVSAPQGMSLAGMDAIMRVVEKEIRNVPGVRMVLTTAGGGFLGGVNEGRVYVRLTPHEERVFSLGLLIRNTLAGKPLDTFRKTLSQKEIMQMVRKRLKKLSDVRTSVRNLVGFNIGGGSFEIDFVLRGPDLTALASYAESLRDRADTLGIVDADTTLKLDRPELRLTLDRARADDFGIDPGRIGSAIRLLVGGEEEVSRFRDPAVNEDYDVQLRLREEDRADPSIIGRLFVSRNDGSLVRLDNVARIEEVKSASRIDRLDRQREVRLRASIASGYGLADRLEALRTTVAGMNLPATYTMAVSGRGRELERTFDEFIWAFALSIIFMYMILASQFENLVHPFTILLSLPLTVPFALLSLWITGNTLNLYSALGILVLFGVVKKNAILQIDHMNNLRAAGMERTAAILQGNRDRLRPILMTTLTFVAGMIPLAVGTGPGAEERRVIAVVVIGGQTLALLLTLLATPVVYSLLDDLGFAFTRWRRPLPGKMMKARQLQAKDAEETDGQGKNRK
ncbi:MAG: efflux RND transporter permease subunit [Alphaproteobacteria bacterium]|uniref:Efflux RND transporter permease subunit n=1 Tax=Candidatus Nitrobium versatile TaxID=2884831 RepID=A0A953JBV7_9BACT|nr:efflux RND transporter permease subunit [Candidatus Nitrobium versatile]